MYKISYSYNFVSIFTKKIALKVYDLDFSLVKKFNACFDKFTMLYLLQSGPTISFISFSVIVVGVPHVTSSGCISKFTNYLYRNPNFMLYFT